MLNRALRAEERSSLKPWFSYLKLFDTAPEQIAQFEESALARCA